MVPYMQVSDSLLTRQQGGLSYTIRANKWIIKGGEMKAFFIGGNLSC